MHPRVQIIISWREAKVGHWVRSGYGRGYLLEPESCVISPGPTPRAARLIIAHVPPPHSLGAPPSGDQDTCIVPSLHADSGGRYVGFVDCSLVSAQAGRTRRFSKMVASKMFNPFISRAVIVWPLIGAERGAPCAASLRLLILQTYWVLLPAQDVSSSAFLLFGQSVRLAGADRPSVAGFRRSFGSGSGDAGGGGEGCASSGCPGLRKGPSPPHQCPRGCPAVDHTGSRGSEGDNFPMSWFRPRAAACSHYHVYG